MTRVLMTSIGLVVNAVTNPAIVDATKCSFNPSCIMLFRSNTHLLWSYEGICDAVNIEARMTVGPTPRHSPKIPSFRKISRNAENVLQ